MTTINCSLNCIHQEDGKCSLDKITVNTVSTGSDCVFYQEKALKPPIPDKIQL